jgi:hypothetical protein
MQYNEMFSKKDLKYLGEAVVNKTKPVVNRSYHTDFVENVETNALNSLGCWSRKITEFTVIYSFQSLLGVVCRHSATMLAWEERKFQKPN